MSNHRWQAPGRALLSCLDLLRDNPFDTAGEFAGTSYQDAETKSILVAEEFCHVAQAATHCPVPQQTAPVAKAAFPKGNLCLTLRDELGTLFSNEAFADLFPTRGQPAQAPWRLALVTILQYVENLADRQAAEAVRSRIDWKYLLGLQLTDAGFDASVLCEFRARLVSGQADARLFEWSSPVFMDNPLSSH